MRRQFRGTRDAGFYGQCLALLLPLLAPAFGSTAELVYDNGPFINQPGQGPGGSDGSVVQTSLGHGVSAWPAVQAYGSRVADDFTVPPGQSWFVSWIRFFAEFPLAPTDSSFSGISLRIWNGRPDMGSSEVVWGDSETNVRVGSGFTGAYRYWEGAPNTLEPIFWVDAGVNSTLSPGTYWLDWAFSGPEDVFGDPHQIPITVNGRWVTGNALWYTGGWAPLVDIGAGTSAYAQGLPFQIYTGVPPGRPLRVVMVLDRAATWDGREQALKLSGKVLSSRPCQVNLSVIVEEDTRHPVAVGSSAVSIECSRRCDWTTPVKVDSFSPRADLRVRLAFEAVDDYGRRFTREVVRKVSTRKTRLDWDDSPGVPGP